MSTSKISPEKFSIKKSHEPSPENSGFAIITNFVNRILNQEKPSTSTQQIASAEALDQDWQKVGEIELIASKISCLKEKIALLQNDLKSLQHFSDLHEKFNFFTRIYLNFKTCIKEYKDIHNLSLFLYTEKILIPIKIDNDVLEMYKTIGEIDFEIVNLIDQLPFK